MQGLAYGWRTALLSVVVAQVLILAAAFARSPRNRTANRTLAALLIVLAGILTPWMIGFAGFYDRWRWLTFAPFAITLAVGPLIWLYVRALTDDRWPDRATWNLAPPALQFAYFLACFLLPEPLKDRWADASSGFAAALQVAAALSLGVYGLASLSALKRYRRRLADHRSDDARYAADWLSRAILASLLLLPVWTVYVAWDAISPLGYVNLMGLYLTIAAFALYIGVEGWRHAGLNVPALVNFPQAAAAARDWAQQGHAWAARVREQGWAADPDLSLAVLAAHLATNTGYLSRALNDGLGVNFSTFVNGLRAEAVAHALDDGDRRDLLDLAFEAGFTSKASFNRAFRMAYGQSPSAYRQASNSEKMWRARETEARPANGFATPPA